MAHFGDFHGIAHKPLSNSAVRFSDFNHWHFGYAVGAQHKAVVEVQAANRFE
ncbi:TPA: hypothetical protein RI749_003332 [Vibrio cholerae]|nr:hypothetical protein [Vibrio cholerae]HDV5416284.1 hypothetical protein [Vibrio cholerae]HDV5522974.1 hypothetical protein [Vibrio cholerae]HDV5571897.1 hypothetical protein [Vibrio cholerae]HDV5645603.1 hypothetical protein [Vibrio cholerae]